MNVSSYRPFSRNEVPLDLVRGYFAQEHFSLKKLIATAEKSAMTSMDTKMLIACTRSDAVINRIPSYSISGDMSLDVVKALVHQNTNSVVTEHLDALRSEARLRASLLAWIENSSRSTFVLIVDMGKSGAVERTNFTRMFLEQVLSPRSGKVVVFLLHFPGSSASFYPALFLGGWQHYFLDSVGQIECDARVETFIEAACTKMKETEMPECSTGNQIEDIAERLESMLPRVLSHVAAKKILHSDQVKKTTISFGNNSRFGHSDRYDLLISLFQKPLCGQTIGKLFCKKFGELWLKNGLQRTMNRASERLLTGTTNLPLSMSLLSCLVETFDMFVTLQLCEMNHDRNLDIILQEVVNQEAEELFGLILHSLPLPPFEELVLRRGEGIVVRGLLVPENQDNLSSIFPFFDFVASCMNEVVEAALRKITKDSSVVNEHGIGEYCRLVYACSSKLLQVEKGDQSIQSQRRKSANQAAEFVKSGGRKNSFLFSCYVNQFVEKIAGKATSNAPTDWVKYQAKKIDLDHDILAVHVICKVRETQFISIASWATRFGALVTWPSEFTECSEVRNVESGRFLFNRLLEHFEGSLKSVDLSRSEWATSFALFFHESNAMLAQNGIQDNTTARRMRALCFFYVVVRCGAYPKIEASLFRRWYRYDDKTNLHFSAASEEVSLFYFARVAPEGQNHGLLYLLLRFFFSATWIKLTTTFRNDDFKFLIDMISSADHDGHNYHAAVALLQMAFWSFRASSGPTVLDLPNEPLQHVSIKVASCDSFKFSNEGETWSVSHYTPEWLQRSNQLRAQCLDLADCTPHVKCELSRVVFDVMLRSCLEQTKSLTSDTILLLLLADVEPEAGFSWKGRTRLASVHATAESWESFKGTPMASIGVAARLICFVAKVAHDLASTGQSVALSGIYFEATSRLFEGLMSNNCLHWDDFFFGTILRIRGEGTLAELLKHDGALGSFEWCREWANGAPALVHCVENQLAAAERDLAEATAEEERKVQEFRLCPHCAQEFAIGARNCGVFVCGRDYHSQIQAFGCGQQFQVDTAPRYVSNDQYLTPLRERIQEERARLQTNLEGAALWKRAREFTTPVLDFFALKTTTLEPLLPTAYIIPPHEPPKDDTNLSLFRLLERSSSLLSKLKVLPDLIEVRTNWVNCNGI